MISELPNMELLNTWENAVHIVAHRVYLLDGYSNVIIASKKYTEDVWLSSEKKNALQLTYRDDFLKLEYEQNQENTFPDNNPPIVTKPSGNS